MYDEELKPVPFTQYVLPNGRREPVAIDRPPHVYDKAQEIINAGYRFECEILTTGHVSFSIHDIAEEEDVSIEICNNGPSVPDTVDNMIMGFTIPQPNAEQE